MYLAQRMLSFQVAAPICFRKRRTALPAHRRGRRCCDITGDEGDCLPFCMTQPLMPSGRAWLPMPRCSEVRTPNKDGSPLVAAECQKPKPQTHSQRATLHELIIHQHRRAKRRLCFPTPVFRHKLTLLFYLVTVHSLSATYKYFKTRPLSFINGQAAKLSAASWQSPRVNGKTSLRTGPISGSTQAACQTAPCLSALPNRLPRGGGKTQFGFEPRSGL